MSFQMDGGTNIFTLIGKKILSANTPSFYRQEPYSFADKIFFFYRQNLLNMSAYDEH